VVVVVVMITLIIKMLLSYIQIIFYTHNAGTFVISHNKEYRLSLFTTGLHS
jgi:hypothetical protein